MDRMILWRIAGLAFLSIGWIGIFLPLLPTTIFWILAALCFARSDPKLRDWIYARPHVGPQVQLFIERGEMTKAGKRGALFGMMIAAGFIAWLGWHRPLFLTLGLGLVSLGALYVVTRPTGTPKSDEGQDRA